MGGSFSEVFEGAVRRAGSDARGVADPEGIFVHVEFPGVDISPRGWKLHVSATPFNAERVLDVCLGPLLEARAPFKFAASLDRLIELNEGTGGLGQVGKFITVYPSTSEDAVAIARALDEVTAGERGPSVLTDKALSATSLVHYRFADFVPGREADEVEPPADPFVAAGLVREGPRMLVGSRYLITATLHKAVRGAVQLAVDTDEKRSVILKRAWRDALMTPDGRDARDRLREEAEVLRRVQGDVHFPQLYDVFEDFGDLFVAMEFLEGKSLARAVADRVVPFDIVTLGRELATALRVLHSEGFVHRDLNPVNVVIDGGVRLIDFELAQPIGAPATEYAAGTVGYVSQNQQQGGPPALGDDLYGLGCLLFFAATGRDPKPGMARTEVQELLRAQPPHVREVIDGLLAEETPPFTSIDEVLGLLASASAGSPDRRA